MRRFQTYQVTLDEANAFITAHHRHHPRARGCRFALALEEGGAVVGVAVVGRTKARRADKRQGLRRLVCEVTRLCTDGTRDACSALYSACRRVAQALGYERVITYTLPSEGGASLRAAGWEDEGLHGGGSWDREERPREDSAPTEIKRRWACILLPGAA